MKRVLVVDDDQFILRALARVLRTEFQVEVATNGAEALARLEELKPDVVISDLAMPGIDGCELLAEVRRRNPYCKTFLLSGAQGERTAGFEVLLKPWKAQDLISRLQAAPAPLCSS